MNSLNVNQFEGGTQVKQGDSASVFGFELLDENYNPIDLDGKTATIKLVSMSKIGFETTAVVQANKVSWTVSDILPVDSYTLEIVVDGYVFPSDRQTRITVTKSATDYQQANLVPVDYQAILKEIEQLKASQGSISDAQLNQIVSDYLRDHPLETVDLSPLNERLTALENKTDNDTIFDDSNLTAQINAIREQISKLTDNDTIYDDTALSNRVSTLESRPAQSVDLSDYAKRSELPARYNDTAIKESIKQLTESLSTLSSAGYDDTDLRELVASKLTSSDYQSDKSHFEAELQELTADVRVLQNAGNSSVVRPPMAYALGNSSTSYDVLFDNGCALRHASRYITDSTSGNIYGVGMKQDYLDDTKLYGLPVQVDIINLAKRSVASAVLAVSNGVALWHGSDLSVLNPVQESSKYDFASAYFNQNDTNATSKANQPKFIENLFKLGVFSESQILGFGAVKK